MGKALPLDDRMLLIPPSEEIKMFLLAAGLGCIFSFIFCIINALRDSFKLRGFLAFTLDFLFVFCSFYSLFLFFLEHTLGVLRWFIFAGVICGFYIFKKIFGIFLLTVFKACLRPFAKILQGVNAILKAFKRLVKVK